jgi:fatty acid desaturase
MIAMPESQFNESSFSLATARHLVSDLFAPRPWIYWTDFLVSAAIGNAAIGILFVAVREPSRFAPSLPLAVRIAAGLAAYIVGSLAFYRISLFIHELAHMRSGAMPVFRVAWNLLCGIPFLIPSFVYASHIGHHRRNLYGTELDGEYLAFGLESPWSIVKHLAMNFVLPILTVLRFLVIGPISWFVPPLRRRVLRHASSMVIDFRYRRPEAASRSERLGIFVQELLCFAWLLSIAVVPPVFLGRWPIPFIIVGYSVSVFILTLNAVRSLGSHRFHFDKQHEVGFVDQLLDSVNVHRSPLISELWGPIGTRYHALHHLFPGMPYHSMPEAHRRLTAGLPAGSAYHRTEEPSLTAALLDLWRRSVAAGSGNRTRASTDQVGNQAVIAG